MLKIEFNSQNTRDVEWGSSAPRESQQLINTECDKASLTIIIFSVLLLFINNFLFLQLTIVHRENTSLRADNIRERTSCQGHAVQMGGQKLTNTSIQTGQNHVESSSKSNSSVKIRTNSSILHGYPDSTMVCLNMVKDLI